MDPSYQFSQGPACSNIQNYYFSPSMNVYAWVYVCIDKEWNVRRGCIIFKTFLWFGKKKDKNIRLPTFLLAVLTTGLCSHWVFLEIPRNQNALFHGYWNESFWCSKIFIFILAEITCQIWPKFLKNFRCFNLFLGGEHKKLPKYTTFQYFTGIS